MCNYQDTYIIIMRSEIPDTHGRGNVGRDDHTEALLQLFVALVDQLIQRILEILRGIDLVIVGFKGGNGQRSAIKSSLDLLGVEAVCPCGGLVAAAGCGGGGGGRAASVIGRRAAHHKQTSKQYAEGKQACYYSFHKRSSLFHSTRRSPFSPVDQPGRS